MYRSVLKANYGAVRNASPRCSKQIFRNAQRNCCNVSTVLLSAVPPHRDVDLYMLPSSPPRVRFILATGTAPGSCLDLVVSAITRRERGRIPCSSLIPGLLRGWLSERSGGSPAGRRQRGGSSARCRRARTCARSGAELGRNAVDRLCVLTPAEVGA